MTITLIGGPYDGRRVEIPEGSTLVFEVGVGEGKAAATYSKRTVGSGPEAATWWVWSKMTTAQAAKLLGGEW